MRKFLLKNLFLLFTLVSLSVFSQRTYTTTSTGSWTSATWTCSGSGCSSANEVPNGNDLKGNTIIINHDLTSNVPNFTLDGNTSTLVINATVTGTSSITLRNQAVLDVNGTGSFELQTYSMSGGTFTSDIDISILGNLTITNSNSSFTMNGNLSVAETIRVQDSRDVVFNGDIAGKDFAEINASARVFINGDAVFTGEVLVTDGGDLLGSGTLTLGTARFTNGSTIDGDGNCDIDAGDIGSTSPYFIDLNTCTNSPLPIELAFFSVEKTNDGFYYNWQTFTEIDNDYFVIEYSANLKTFTELTSVPGAGTSYDLLDYEYFSNDLFLNSANDAIYFRLKQVDFDGTFSYSPIVAISLENVLFSDFALFPNPATEVLTLRMNTGDPELTKEVLIFDTMSNELKAVFSFSGVDSDLDVSALASGVYIVKIVGVGTPTKLVIH